MPVAIVIGILLQSPANAGTWTDVEVLKEELGKTGTKVLELKCKENDIMSYYEFEEKKTDQIVICINNKVYGSWDKRQEVEARWMELQIPELAIKLLQLNCKGVTQ